MKILFVTQYFPPEIEAGAFRIYETAKYFLKYGHDVTILCGIPNFPTGKVLPAYRKKLFFKETMDGINVIRVWVYPTKNDGFLGRVLNYISFVIAALGAAPLLGKTDIVVATSPPLFTGFIGAVMRFIKNAPLVFDVRDIWPDSAEVLGLLKNRLIIKVLYKLERYIYNVSSAVVVVSEGYGPALIAKGVSVDKLCVIPNGFDVGNISASKYKKSRIMDRLGLDNKFVILYAGTHGISQKLATILDCANLLKSSDDIRFLLIGEGADKDSLISYKNRLNLKNVFFIDQIPRDELGSILSLSDAIIVHLKSCPLFLYVVPSKLYEAMAFGKPVILGIEGEAKTILQKAGGGVCIRPENAVDMKEAVVRIYSDKMFADRCGINGREFVKINYDCAKLAKKYEMLVSSIAANYKNDKMQSVELR